MTETDSPVNVVGKKINLVKNNEQKKQAKNKDAIKTKKSEGSTGGKGLSSKGDPIIYIKYKPKPNSKLINTKMLINDLIDNKNKYKRYDDNKPIMITTKLPMHKIQKLSKPKKKSVSQPPAAPIPPPISSIPQRTAKKPAKNKVTVENLRKTKKNINKIRKDDKKNAEKRNRISQGNKAQKKKMDNAYKPGKGPEDPEKNGKDQKDGKQGKSSEGNINENGKTEEKGKNRDVGNGHKEKDNKNGRKPKDLANKGIPKKAKERSPGNKDESGKKTSKKNQDMRMKKKRDNGSKKNKKVTKKKKIPMDR